MKTLKELRENMKDNEEHHLFNKRNKLVVAKFSNKKAAQDSLVDTHRMHPDLTVLHKDDQQYRK